MHLRCPRSQSLTVQGRASLVLLVFYHASTSYCGVTFTQLLEFLCPLIRNSRALVRCNSISCYNKIDLQQSHILALVRCNSISCYNKIDLQQSHILALVRCNSISCYNLYCQAAKDGLALVRCNSISCYNNVSPISDNASALVRCNSISCYNTHPRKSPLSRGFTVIEF